MTVPRDLMAEVDRVVAEAEADIDQADQEVRTWIIKKNLQEFGDYDFHTVCPWCQAVDQICERDTAVRWNTLTVQNPNSAIAHTGPYEFDGDGWICGECTNDALVAPEGFEIRDWF